MACPIRYIAKEPLGQWQLSGLQHGAGRERALVATAAALVQGVGTRPNAATRGALAARADKAIGPAYLLQCGDALLLGAVALKELRQGQAVLELD